jgi:arylsulfatase A
MMKTNPPMLLFSSGEECKCYTNNFFVLLPGTVLYFFVLVFSSCRKDFNEVQFSTESNNAHNVSLSSKPNIIFILSDDVGYEIPGYTGGQSYSTPHIDAFAANSIQFTQCHATPLCSPSRVELLTGKYNFRNYTGWGVFPTGDKTFVNMLHNAGYVTCLSGKWQFGGADATIKKAGFDTYCINGAGENGIYKNGRPLAGRWYKNPHIYQNGKLLPDSLFLGKYGQDIFRDFIFDFIDNNKNNSKPFFIYWTPNLCHRPFSPTPDDSQFETWNPDKPEAPGDTIYFPSMVKYLDKIIYQLLNKINASGIENNTVIIFAGDNGSPVEIFSNYQGQRIKGGKGTTIETGIHVPLIVNSPGFTKAGSVNNDLIDLCDFWPTILGIAGVSYSSADNPTLDGISFLPQIQGNTGKKRPWSFCYFQPHPEKADFKITERWVKNTVYKRYDSTIDPAKKGLYNFQKDYKEKAPIPYYKMTLYEQNINDRFLHILDSLQ